MRKLHCGQDSFSFSQVALILVCPAAPRGAEETTTLQIHCSRGARAPSAESVRTTAPTGIPSWPSPWKHTVPPNPCHASRRQRAFHPGRALATHKGAWRHAVLAKLFRLCSLRPRCADPLGPADRYDHEPNVPNLTAAHAARKRWARYSARTIRGAQCVYSSWGNYCASMTRTSDLHPGIFLRIFKGRCNDS